MNVLEFTLSEARDCGFEAHSWVLCSEKLREHWVMGAAVPLCPGLRVTVEDVSSFIEAGHGFFSCCFINLKEEKEVGISSQIINTKSKELWYSSDLRNVVLLHCITLWS